MDEQKLARTLAGNSLIENTVSWDKPYEKDLYKKAVHILNEKGIEGKFADYCNFVGNYRDVLTVAIDTEMYVVSEKDEKYIESYQAQMEREHRPDFITFPLDNGKFLFLAKFMGSEIIDYSNAKHLELIADLAMNFSDKSTFDRNLGNLLISGDQLFYIDKDLFYVPLEDPRIQNIQDIFFSIEENLHLEHERVKSKNVVKKWIEPGLKPENPKDLEILKNFFPNKFTFEEYIQMIDPKNHQDLWILEKNYSAFFTTPEDFLACEKRFSFAFDLIGITNAGIKCLLKIQI